MDMWGDKTKYYLLSFITGIVVSKFNFYFIGHICTNSHSSFLCNVNAILLPLLLFIFISFLISLKQYNSVICVSIIFMFCLGYNGHHYFNPNIIVFKSDFADSIKNYCIDMCNVIPPKYACYVKALLFGDRSGISIGDKDLFIKTGTLHLFALSGLHTGIVYSMIYYAFYPLKLLRNKWIHMSVCCMVLVLYSFISGASSSVLRATTMISIYCIFKRRLIKSSKGDILLFTGFILSLVSPDSIFEAGFQLSFAAMLGIFYIYPYLKSCINRLKLPVPIRYILNLTSITLSCQIATFPISLFYFGSVSPIFILGNIFAVPLVTLIIYASICSLILQRSIILFICIEKVLTLLFELLFYIINLLGN